MRPDAHTSAPLVLTPSARVRYTAQARELAMGEDGKRCL